MRSVNLESTNFSACGTQSKMRSSSALAWPAVRLLLDGLTSCRVASRYTVSTPSCRQSRSLLCSHLRSQELMGFSAELPHWLQTLKQPLLAL